MDAAISFFLPLAQNLPPASSPSMTFQINRLLLTLVFNLVLPPIWMHPLDRNTLFPQLRRSLGGGRISRVVCCLSFFFHFSCFPLILIWNPPSLIAGQNNPHQQPSVFFQSVFELFYVLFFSPLLPPSFTTYPFFSLARTTMCVAEERCPPRSPFSPTNKFPFLRNSLTKEDRKGGGQVGLPTPYFLSQTPHYIVTLPLSSFSSFIKCHWGSGWLFTQPPQPLSKFIHPDIMQAPFFIASFPVPRI